MNSQERAKYWRQNIRITRQLEAKYKPQVLRIFRKAVDKFIDNRDSVEMMDEELVRVYSKIYKETVIRFANEQYRRLKSVKSFGFNAEWANEVNEWLATEGFKLITSVTGNMRNVILGVINKQITNGVNEGLSVTEINTRILEALKELKDSTISAYIAERIVRTELGRAANIGHMKGASKAKFEVVKVWISAIDERTRRMPRDQFSHIALDGQTREFDEPFKQIGTKGVEAIADFPLDPKAPPAFTINCRCTIAFEGKRDANGRLIPKKITG